MEIDVRKRRNQRNKRRERAQRMQAERDRDSVDSAGSTTNVSNSGNSAASREPTGNGTNTAQSQPATITNQSSIVTAHDSADEDMANKPPIREKPPPRRKKPKEQSPLLEEDIVDGFAILAFKTYEDLEVSHTHKHFYFIHQNAIISRCFIFYVCEHREFAIGILKLARNSFGSGINIKIFNSTKAKSKHTRAFKSNTPESGVQFNHTQQIRSIRRIYVENPIKY